VGVGAGGSTTTVKDDELCAVPPGVVTAIAPVAAAAGTVAWISVGETTANVAATPPNVTLLAPAKLVPEMVTAAPGGPDAGENCAIVGPAAPVFVTVNAVPLWTLPDGVVTVTGPVLAPAGTEAWICDAETTW
jgi:hypothetical protein